MPSLKSFVTTVELLITFLLILLLIVYLKYRRCYKFWQRLGIEQLNPIFPVGDLSTSPFGRKSAYHHYQHLYNQFKQKQVTCGGIYFFKGPALMLISPELIKRVMVTDFEYFTDRGFYINKEKLPITAHLLSMKGQEWRNLRTKITPVFTFCKIKSMFNILQKNVDNLINILNEYNNGDELDIKYKLTRLTTDIIGATTLGVDCNTLKYPDAKFAKMVDAIFGNSPLELLKLVVEEGVDNPGNIVKIPHNKKHVTKFFTNLIENTIKHRDENRVTRNDFLNVLIKLRDTDGMSLDEIVAQAFLFFLAGFETTSTTLSYAVHELAHNQHVQDRLRQEVLQNLGKNINSYTYESVLELSYLDKVVKETLRKHPISVTMNRVVVKPYKLPGTDIVLQPGIPVVVPFLGLHRDPEYYPNPLEFNPERFNNHGDDSKSKIVPYTYLPFGSGPRNCIGLRFATIQAQLVIAGLIANFKFLPGKDSQRELPIDTSNSLILRAKGGVPVKLFKL